MENSQSLMVSQYCYGTDANPWWYLAVARIVFSNLTVPLLPPQVSSE